jgi:hypothetical protein
VRINIHCEDVVEIPIEKYLWVGPKFTGSGGRSFGDFEFEVGVAEHQAEEA